MKILSFGCLAAILALTQASAEAAKRYPIEPGDVILANCHEIYSKGIVKAKVDDGYTVDFPKGSGPLHRQKMNWRIKSKKLLKNKYQILKLNLPSPSKCVSMS